METRMSLEQPVEDQAGPLILNRSLRQKSQYAYLAERQNAIYPILPVHITSRLGQKSNGTLL